MRLGSERLGFEVIRVVKVRGSGERLGLEVMLGG